ncbi:MAG: tripartite tricarboxylate transporter substrate binding protein [Burkholderiales bacterium]|nr:tripartite tricarboxylate transporter substrate binding protein [Burkholderiales bacterium]
MKLMRKISGLLALCVLATSVAAATFPDRPVRLIVPFPAGGTSDILARLLQTPASAAAGQQFVIENRPGGASTIGSSAVARAPADGHTLLVADLAIVVNPSLLKDMPYNTTKDFRGVIGLAKAPLVLLVNANVPANTLQELMAMAKARPGSLNFASGGNGASTHMAGEMFKLATGLDIVHVPFQGVAPAMNALLGGQVEIYFGGTTTAQAHLASGKLKALAVTSDTRSPLLPNVPTFKESGVQGMNADTYWGLYAPAGTDDARVKALNDIFRRAMADPAVVARTRELGLELIPNSPQEQQKQFTDMVQYWSDFIRKTGIKVE